MPESVRIALIHATPAAIGPIADAFRRLWPQPVLANLLDDSLSRDLARSKRLDERFDRRFADLMDYSIGNGADGILFTCSAFGSCIEKARARTDKPILKPNEAMIDAALEMGGRIGLVASFGPSIPSMVEEFHQAAAARGRKVTIETALADGAMDVLLGGDPDRHDDMVAAAAATLPPVDVVALAQFSMASAADKVAAATGRPVLATPDSAVARLRSLFAKD